MFCAIALWAIWFHVPSNTSFDAAHGYYPLPKPVSIIAAFCGAMALGSLCSLFWANRHRLRPVFRPNFGRIFSSAVMALMTPFYVIIFLPFTFLAKPSLKFGDLPFAAGTTQTYSGLFAEWPVILLAFGLWYPASCLIISGIADRGVRVLLFAQMWIGVYCLVILANGLVYLNL